MSTPLMTQYGQIKAQYPDTILLFRMGDFYETFQEDALVTSKVLGITLTKRGNGAAGNVPLAGFPHHALDTYLPKLLKAGHRVAVCEQLEDPKLAKGIVKRDVIEVVTPGVAYSDRVLENKQNNFLAAIALPSPNPAGTESIGLSFVDVSTAEFSFAEFSYAQLAEQIASLSPAEILIQKRDANIIQDRLSASFSGLFTKMEDWLFNHDYAYELLTAHFKTRSLKGFGAEESRIGIAAAGAVLTYLQETQKNNIEHIRKLTSHDVSGHMVLDHSTKRNLEITSSLSNLEEGTLFSVLDKTETPMGGRLLKRWIHQPLTNVGPIVERLDAVEELLKEGKLQLAVKNKLAAIGDLERLNTKICTGRATPRDLIALKEILRCCAETAEIIRDVQAPGLMEIRSGLQPLPEAITLIESSIESDPPPALADGNTIKRGYNTELDELRTIAHSGKEWIASLQQEEKARTGINSLKVGFNNVFGYYLEITNTHKDKVPSDYIRKQTMTNAERYITPALKEYEEKILGAEEKILTLESRLFNEIRIAVMAHAETIQNNARLIATLDCFLSLSVDAGEYGYTRPEVNESTRLEIRQGRHPVIERLLPPGEKYTANDVAMSTDDQQILIITGPNMSGKSSYLRQVGLIALLAQIGSFVPAKSATIGLVDRIYTRVGASDNIASGESTFLVEMHEAANIVNTATPRSLILLDEVGRGTSTFDGISIAWALTEYVHERVGARTLFATHYHELNELADLFSRIRNYKVDVREYGDKVVFLHKVTPGFADHSYGIQVAQMAGMPEEVTNKAKVILQSLEQFDLGLEENDRSNGKRSGRAKGRMKTSEIQMGLFELKDDSLRDELRAIDINSITPMEAMQKLAELKNRVDQQ